MTTNDKRELMKRLLRLKARAERKGLVRPVAAHFGEPVMVLPHPPVTERVAGPRPTGAEDERADDEPWYASWAYPRGAELVLGGAGASAQS